MVILHIVSVKKPNGNGVVVAVNNYAKYESNNNYVAIYNIETSIANYVDKDIKVFSYNDYNTIAQLPTPFNNPDIVIFNEVYKMEYLKLYKECIKNKKSYIIIPHGCLVKKAQNNKKWKKIIGNLIFFNSFINHSLAIQYLNNDEKENSVMRKHKYIISGNGIEINNIKNKYKSKNFVYIGRYDIKVKGLDLLIKTIMENIDWFNKNKVVIQLYGRNSGNGYETLKKIITDNKIDNILYLNNEIYGLEKQKVLLDSYTFIQVSRHEGQPIGIMEALSYGLPCIVTYGTSFGDYINNNQCGVGIDFNSKSLFNAIKKMYEDEKFRNMCSERSKIIEKDYEWNSVINSCLNEYKELL